MMKRLNSQIRNDTSQHVWNQFDTQVHCPVRFEVWCQIYDPIEEQTWTQFIRHIFDQVKKDIK